MSDTQFAQVAVLGNHSDFPRPNTPTHSLDGALLAGEHYLDPRQLQRLLNGRSSLVKVEGINDEEAFHPQCGDEFGDVHPAVAGPLEGLIRARIHLHPGHTGPTVVQDDQREGDLVLHCVDQTGDAGVEEGGIADGGNDRRLGPPVNESLCQADAGAHRDLGPGGVERGVHP